MALRSIGVLVLCTVIPACGADAARDDSGDALPGAGGNAASWMDWTPPRLQ